MKVLMVSIFGSQAANMLSNEALINLRQLMQMGAYGRIMGSDKQNVENDFHSTQTKVWEAYSRSSRGSLWLTSKTSETTLPPSADIYGLEWNKKDHFVQCRSQFSFVHERMAIDGWDLCLIDDHGFSFIRGKRAEQEYSENIDQGLGSLFEELDNETLVIILFRHETELTAFIISSPLVEPIGEILDAGARDVASTIFHLLGLVAAEDLKGRILLSLSSQDEGTEKDLLEIEQAILRERLSGLGYL